MFERKPPIRSTQEDVVELAEDIDRFVIGLAERIDAIQDAELAQKHAEVAELSRTLSSEADRLGYANSAELRAGMIARYCAARGFDAARREAFGLEAALLAAQRNLKIVGIFARLCLRDGKPRYVDLIPRVWAHLERDLSHPALAGLRSFVAAHLPAPTAETRARLRAGAGRLG